MVIKNAPDRLFPFGLMVLGILCILWTQDILSKNEFKELKWLYGIGVVEILLVIGLVLISLGLYAFYKTLSKRTLYTIDKEGIWVHKKNQIYYFKDLGYYEHYITTHKSREFHGIIIYKRDRKEAFVMNIPVDVSAYEIIEILSKHLSPYK